MLKKTQRKTNIKQPLVSKSLRHNTTLVQDEVFCLTIHLYFAQINRHLVSVHCSDNIKLSGLKLVYA